MEASLHLSPSDEFLAQRLQAGDDAAFDELFRRYAHPLAAYAARILRDTAAGEDVAQTSLLRAYQAIRSGTEPQHVRAWLYTIARNVALDSRGKGELEYDAELDGRPDPAPTIRSARADLVAALRSLPERQRRAYLLRELRGLSIAEIAAELDLTHQQVQQAIFAARNKLAEQLSFGGRLSCAEVRAVDRRSLDLGQRRALKSHLRDCPECRAATGRLGWSGGLSVVAALRDLLGGLFGSGSTLGLAKVGTALVVASLGVATPTVAAQVTRHPDHRAIAPAPAASAPVVSALPARTVEAPAIDASRARSGVSELPSTLVSESLARTSRVPRPPAGRPSSPQAPVDTPAPTDDPSVTAGVQPADPQAVDDTSAPATDDPAPADPGADDSASADPALDAAPVDPSADDAPPPDAWGDQPRADGSDDPPPYDDPAAY